MRYWGVGVATLMAIGLTASAVAAQRFEGTAIVRVDDDEYTIPIECDDSARPELGFSTEPSRITRERTGRTSGVNLRLRGWPDQPGETVVTLDRYVVWTAQPSSAGGTLSMTLDMSPVSVVRDGVPALLTYDMWTAGDRPTGISGVYVEAQCTSRDPEAPSYRKIPG